MMAATAAGPAVGILGGGQLGRMLCMAAHQLGCTTHVYDPQANCPASQVTQHFTCAAYDDVVALTAFAASVDVVTFEFENVPAATAAQVASLVPLFPRAGVLAVAQDRLAEKSFAQDLGIATPAFAAVHCPDTLRSALKTIGAPAVLKTRRLGYDGKGQLRLTAARVSAKATALLAAPCILEAFVPFDSELSIIAACSQAGEIAFYPAVQNSHAKGILVRSQVPATVAKKAVRNALAATRKIADALDYVGVFAVEYFVLGDNVIFNEIAPRVHNSGHWTIEGAHTSQFENHIRAICDWPLGDTAARGAVEMHNIIGADIKDFAAMLATPGLHVHHYGKTEILPGRKMGHVTRVRPT